jgi:hypothetical protein
MVDTGGEEARVYTGSVDGWPALSPVASGDTVGLFRKCPLGFSPSFFLFSFFMPFLMPPVEFGIFKCRGRCLQEWKGFTVTENLVDT